MCRCMEIWLYVQVCIQTFSAKAVHVRCARLLFLLATVLHSHLLFASTAKEMWREASMPFASYMFSSNWGLLSGKMSKKGTEKFFSHAARDWHIVAASSTLRIRRVLWDECERECSIDKQAWLLRLLEMGKWLCVTKSTVFEERERERPTEIQTKSEREKERQRARERVQKLVGAASVEVALQLRCT